MFNSEWVEKVARVCHEANRAYCIAIGDDSQPSWEQAPDWQKGSARMGVLTHLSALDSGAEILPSMSHDFWLEQKRKEGWKYGQVKDAEKKEHPCFLPYEQLPPEQRVKDYIFGHVVRAFHEALR